MIPDRLAFERYFTEAPADCSIDALDESRIPRHVAVIMDGNGRWAKRQGLSRGHGHMAGVDALKQTITSCVRLGVDVLTVYAFSTENWTRPKEEVDLLMHLFAQTLISELPLMHEENVRLVYLGDLSGLPEETQRTFERGLAETAENTGLTLAVAVNYGGRQELTVAVKNVARMVEEGSVSIEQIDEGLISSQLWTGGLPDPELLIRTSGEKRLSNYLLWQCAYSEFVFLDVLWPDFTRWDLIKAILEYQSRDRRFGGLTGDQAR